MGKNRPGYRKQTVAWIPTDCACGPGGHLLKAKPACSCKQITKRKRRNSVVEVAVTGLTPEQLADAAFMTARGLEELIRQRRRSTAAQAKQAEKQTAGRTKKMSNPVVLANLAPANKATPKASRDYRTEYVTYIASAAWRAKRREYIAVVAPTECPVCEGPWGPGDHIHHKSYEHMGAEPLEDLVHLCEACHDKLHALYQRPVWRRRGLRATTDHVLARGLRALPALPRGHTVETLALSDLA